MPNLHGLQPDISLGVAGGGGPGAPPLPGQTGLLANPLGALKTFTDLAATQQGIAATQQQMDSRALEIQSQQNAIKQFNQSFSARQQMGATIAAAPDLETGLKAVQANPQIMAWPDLSNGVRQLMLSGAQYHLTQQETATSRAQEAEGWAGAGERQTASALNVAHQTQVQSVTNENSVSGLARRLVASNPSNVQSTIDSYVASQPQALQPMLRQVGSSLTTALTDPTGLSQDPTVAAGQHTQRAAGLAVATGTNPGDLVPFMGGITTADVGGVPRGMSIPGVLQPNGQTTLLPEGGQQTGTGATLGMGVSKEQTQAYAGPEADSYQASTRALPILSDMSTALDQLAKSGTFMRTGAAGAIRSDIASVINTASTLVGGKPLFSPQALASAELFQKDAIRLRDQVATQMLGTQQKAAQTLDSEIQAIPGLNNTYLGGKLIVDSITAATQRNMQQHIFNTNWLATHDNKLTGADIAFNKENPPEQMERQVLDKYGLDKMGFKSEKAIGNAIANGYLTQEQGRAEAVRLWPDKYHQ